MFNVVQFYKILKLYSIFHNLRQVIEQYQYFIQFNINERFYLNKVLDDLTITDL